MLPTHRCGALVVSLDFELHWGVRDKTPTNGPYRKNLLGVWSAVPRILALFEEYKIGATWATVGFLFAQNRDELLAISPTVRPRYVERKYDPYAEIVGADEHADPLHFAPSLVAQVRATPRQEIGTHTFSHYFCLELGQTREAFGADLRAAVGIASRCGLRLHSIVFPRNQHNPEYDDILSELDLTIYRGTQRGWMYHPTRDAENSIRMRAARFADSYWALTGPQTTLWSNIPKANGLYNVEANCFLRPYSPRLRFLEPLRRKRVADSIRYAARTGSVIHLWWHPHNFGTFLEENIAFLRSLLDVYSRCHQDYGMKSMTMFEAAKAMMPKSL